MEGVEELAYRHSRTLLTLDTLAGSVAEKLYLSLAMFMLVQFQDMPVCQATHS